MLGQLLAEQAAALNVEGGVDRFVRNLHRRLLWIFLLQGARNLLRRPVQLETSHDLGPQLGMECQLGRLRPPASTQRCLLGSAGSIALSAPVPGQPSRDFLSLLQAESNLRPLPRPWLNPAGRTNVGSDRLHVQAHMASDSGPRLASLSSPP